MNMKYKQGISVGRHPNTGTYWYRFTINKKVFTGDTLQENRPDAVKALRKIKLNIMREGKQELDRMTLEEARERYYKKHLKNLPTGAERNRKLVLMIDKHLGRSTKLDDITPVTLEGLVEWLRDRGITNATINRYLGVLKAMMYYAKKVWKALKEVPTLDSLKENGERERVLSFDEERDFLERMETCVRENIEREFRKANDLPWKKGTVPFEKNARTYLNLFKIYIDTGVRLHEVLKFDVRRKLDKRRMVIKVLGKGNKEREVDLTQRAFDAFMDEQQHTGDDILFKTTKTAVSKRFKNLFEKLDIFEVTPHNLRHTCATRWVEAGVDIRVIQKLLGHSSIVTTQRYAKVTANATANAVRMTDRYITENLKKEAEITPPEPTNIKEYQGVANG